MIGVACEVRDKEGFCTATCILRTPIKDELGKVRYYTCYRLLECLDEKMEKLHDLIG